MVAYSYLGSELELFAHASHWKSYFTAVLRPYLGAHVLEVGAGIGATTAQLCRGATHVAWTCLEPDCEFVEQLENAKVNGKLPEFCAGRLGTVADLAPGESFDSILYIDVLEHIRCDRAELERAAAHLYPGGFLIVLAPAHNWLFTSFDESIGHYRRYNRATLQAVAPAGVATVRVAYLDSVGLIASAANRLLLRSAMPTLDQILVWDRIMVPCSRWVDPLFRYSLGKSILGVWQKPSRPRCLSEAMPISG